MLVNLPPAPAMGGIGLLAGGLFIGIIGLSTNGWIILEESGSDFKYGLWTLCQCYDIHDGKYWLDGVRGFVVLSLIDTLICVLIGIAMCFLVNNLYVKMKHLVLAAAVCSFFAGVLALIALCIYSARAERTSVGYSFVFTVISSMVSLASGVVFILVYVRLSKHETEEV